MNTIPELPSPVSDDMILEAIHQKDLEVHPSAANSPERVELMLRRRENLIAELADRKAAQLKAQQLARLAVRTSANRWI